jgi:hypothetical protein
MEIPHSEYFNGQLPFLAKIIKIKLCVDLPNWSCSDFHCKFDCTPAYSHCLDSKCCVYNTTVSTYVVIILMLDCGWLYFASKFIYCPLLRTATELSISKFYCTIMLSYVVSLITS